MRAAISRLRTLRQYLFGVYNGLSVGLATPFFFAASFKGKKTRWAVLDSNQ